MHIFRVILMSVLLAGAGAALTGWSAEALTPQQHAVSTPAHEAGAEHSIPAQAEEITSVFGFPITNSMVVSWVVALGLIIFAQVATRKMKDVPDGLQNFWESIVESLRDFLEEIGRAHV
jgi:F-type H+-transporting ATPase subunit a